MDESNRFRALLSTFPTHVKYSCMPSIQERMPSTHVRKPSPHVRMSSPHVRMPSTQCVMQRSYFSNTFRGEQTQLMVLWRSLKMSQRCFRKYKLETVLFSPSPSVVLIVYKHSFFACSLTSRLIRTKFPGTRK